MLNFTVIMRNLILKKPPLYNSYNKWGQSFTQRSDFACMELLKPATAWIESFNETRSMQSTSSHYDTDLKWTNLCKSISIIRCNILSACVLTLHISHFVFRALTLSLGDSQHHPLFYQHVSLLLQLSPDVRGGGATLSTCLFVHWL